LIFLGTGGLVGPTADRCEGPSTKSTSSANPRWEGEGGVERDDVEAELHAEVRQLRVEMAALRQELRRHAEASRTGRACSAPARANYTFQPLPPRAANTDPP
jgi:hypothetical protein